jgi:hypothetical protein
MRLRSGNRNSPPPVRLAGHLHHTAALGQLMTSLYAAGRASYRYGEDDPAPGVPSMTAVMEQLNLKNLDQVVEINPGEHWVMVQGRCRLDRLRDFLAAEGMLLETGEARRQAGTGRPGQSTPKATPRTGKESLTVGAAVITGQVNAIWADLLAKDGKLQRRSQNELPPDALIVAAALRCTW